jgi:hypothetical protein
MSDHNPFADEVKLECIMELHTYLTRQKQKPCSNMRWLYLDKNIQNLEARLLQRVPDSHVQQIKTLVPTVLN